MPLQSLWASHAEYLNLDLSFPPSKPWTMVLPLFGVLSSPPASPLLSLTSLLSFKPNPKYHLPKRPPLTQKRRSGLPVRSFATCPVLCLSHFSSLAHCYLPGGQGREETDHVLSITKSPVPSMGPAIGGHSVNTCWRDNLMNGTICENGMNELTDIIKFFLMVAIWI